VSSSEGQVSRMEGRGGPGGEAGMRA
jgi:hypothetical protein